MQNFMSAFEMLNILRSLDPIEIIGSVSKLAYSIGFMSISKAILLMVTHHCKE